MTLPDPLVPAEVDLRDFAFMPLEVGRLRDSDLASDETPESCWAAVLLWCASWHQVPAGSIPDSDAWIAKQAGYLSRGRIDPAWHDVRPGAMRGWVLCSDGRWYHPVVAEKALESWAGKLRQRWRTECERIRKHAQRHRLDLPAPDFDSWVASGCPTGHPLPVPQDKPTSPPDGGGGPGEVPRETPSKGQGEGQRQGQGQGQREREPSSERASAPDGGDDRPFRSWAEWAAWWRTERGVEVNPSDIRDRKRFVPLATRWIAAKVTPARMRKALEQAERDASEPIAYPPSYVDRVLASMQAPEDGAAAKRAAFVASITGGAAAPESDPMTVDVYATEVPDDGPPRLSARGG